MVKRRDLIRHLMANGCVLLRQGSRHEIWWHRGQDTRAAVPRHREIPRRTAVSICRDLQIPDP